MRRHNPHRIATPLAILAAFGALLGTGTAGDGLYVDPPGGWTYRFEGSQAAPGGGSGFDALDGQWSHNNGSDQWDGSGVGGVLGNLNAPGGVSALTEGVTTFLRFQDPGDPRSYGFADPSNRKLLFALNLSARGATATQIDDGITLSFRARVPTNGPVDPLYRSGQQGSGTTPYPPAGDGHETTDGGRGNILLKQAGGGAVAFSLTTALDTADGNPASAPANFTGLTFNELAGNAISPNVSFGQGSRTNRVAVDVSRWREFWIVLRKDPAASGTHQAFIYTDGSLVPAVFRLTAGNGSDYDALSYLGIGLPSTAQNGALDLDFVACRFGAVFPGGGDNEQPPRIDEVTPASGGILQPAAEGLRFRVRTAGGNAVQASDVRLTLNGLDTTAALQFEGTVQDWQVRLPVLAPNTLYAGEITARDQSGRAATNRVSFDTFDAATALVLDAEEYNFNGGEYHDSAPPSGIDDSGNLVLEGASFFNTSGVEGVDFHDESPSVAANAYRLDPVGTPPGADQRRPARAALGLPEYEVGSFEPGEWLNYTRTFDHVCARAFIRANNSLVQDLRLERVFGNPALVGQVVSPLARFELPAAASAAEGFEWTPALDAFGKPLVFNVAATNGLRTFRLTSARSSADLAVNAMVLVPVPPAEASAVGFAWATPRPDSTDARPDTLLGVELVDARRHLRAESVRMFLDEKEVTLRSVRTTFPTGMRLEHVPLDYLPPGSTHAVKVIYLTEDGGGSNLEALTNTWSFKVAAMPTLAWYWGTPPASVSGKPRGFTGRIHQARSDAPAELFPATVERASAQLAKGIVDPKTGKPFENLAPGPKGDGSFVETGTLNYEQGGLATGIPGDRPFPNATGSDPENLALEAAGFVQFPAGVHRLGVRAHEGFVLLAGPSLADTRLKLASGPGIDLGADGTFDVLVEEPGIYALRLLLFAGRGAADVEVFSVDPVTGTQVPLNAAGSFPVYQSRTGDGLATMPGPQTVTLSMVRSKGGVNVVWPRVRPALELEESSSLAPGSWATAAPPLRNGDRLEYPVPAGTQIQHYRLVYR